MVGTIFVWMIIISIGGYIWKLFYKDEICGIFFPMMILKFQKPPWRMLRHKGSRMSNVEKLFLLGEQKLAGTTQGNLSISEYFLKNIRLCFMKLQNSTMNLCNLFLRYKGWINQPFIVKLENLLSNWKR